MRMSMQILVYLVYYYAALFSAIAAAFFATNQEYAVGISAIVFATAAGAGYGVLCCDYKSVITVFGLSAFSFIYSWAMIEEPIQPNFFIIPVVLINVLLIAGVVSGTIWLWQSRRTCVHDNKGEHDDAKKRLTEL